MAKPTAIVREGSADITEPQGSTHVNAGQLITIQGTDNPQYKTESAPSEDAWDSWNMDRDHRITSAKSWKDTDPYYTGSEDLDTYGTWSEVPDYGQVWIPQQNPNWAPYSDGRWVWEPYYGWTWVSYEPWGWAPYHYGRWFVYGGNWAWWPGPVVGYPGYYPIWSPAYVSFFGWGGGGFGFGVGFGFGFGHVGWLPSGPGDWYHPWWGRGAGRFEHGRRARQWIPRRIPSDRSRRTRVLERERSVPQRSRALRHGLDELEPVWPRSGARRRRTRMSEASFRQASMVSGRMPISPSRAKLQPVGPRGESVVVPQRAFQLAALLQRFRANGLRADSPGAAVNNNVSGRESFGGNRGNSWHALVQRLGQ